MKTELKVIAFFIIIAIFIAACKKEVIEIPHLEANTAMKVELGRKLFFDKNLSNPIGQSCSSCHAPETGFSDLNHNAVSPGAVDGLFGNRNAPSIAYSMFSPPALQYSVSDSGYFGGFFFDGRVNTLEDQAKKPFLNQLEMNNNDADMVVAKVEAASYFSLYKKIYGDVDDDAGAFDNIAGALTAFERSDELNSFSSKYDYYLKGEVALTAQELSGLHLFNDTLKGKCANCHLTDPDPMGGKVVFTDHTYTNDGVPKNPGNPFYTISSAFNPLGAGYIDNGLGGFLGDHAFDGEFKVPTLRNIAISAPYFHNGSFNTLEDVVHFYNIRDVDSTHVIFSPAEVSSTIDHEETVRLNLTAQEEKDIVAFLKTLTDGYR